MQTSKSNDITINTSGNAATSFASRIWPILSLGDRLGRRTAVVVWLAAAIGLGLFSGWSWLVAAGLSSIVLGLLPCAAMCALGLCGGSLGKKCTDKTATKAPPETQP